MAKICTDAGHGGADSGAVWQDAREKDLNLLYTIQLNSELKKRGHTVYTTRTSDVHVPPLGTRCRLVNEHHKQQAPQFDLIVSIHCNAAAVKENGVYKAVSSRRGLYVIYSQESNASRKAAMAVSEQCAAENIHLNHHGMLSTVQLGRTLAWIHKTIPPAVLIELGFMTNPDELALLQSTDYRGKMVTTLADGIEKYLSDSSN